MPLGGVAYLVDGLASSLGGVLPVHVEAVKVVLLQERDTALDERLASGRVGRHLRDTVNDERMKR